LRIIDDGLGLLPFSNAVHYDNEEQRRPVFHDAIRRGALPAGFATEDGVGLVYRGTELAEAVTDTEGKRAFSVGPSSAGEVEEAELPIRLLA
jgi:hypothetical protein